MRLVQITTAAGRRVAVAEDGPSLRVVDGVATTVELATAAIADGQSLATAAETRLSDTTLDYDEVVAGNRLLAPVDHPDPAHCQVAGTGLTHLGSADTRDKMHAKVAGDTGSLTDSMKMFKMGLEAGKPAAGAGVQPEWFYKGDGTSVVPPGGAIEMPTFALDGGEEPEVAGLYFVAADGTPWRLGFAVGNEFSDHVMERQNYLYLAHSKLRPCSIGPELLLGELPDDIRGTSRILRDGAVVWEKPFLSGEANMSHWVRNLEHHHFKYPLFRRPGDVHVHFFGTATLSFADGIVVEPGDVFEIEAVGFGRPLRNPLARAAKAPTTVRVL